MPQPDDRQVMAQAQEIFATKMEGLTAAAARHGVSYTVLYRKVLRGEVEGLKFGREMRVWVDA